MNPVKSKYELQGLINNDPRGKRDLHKCLPVSPRSRTSRTILPWPLNLPYTSTPSRHLTLDVLHWNQIALTGTIEEPPPPSRSPIPKKGSLTPSPRTRRTDQDSYGRVQIVNLRASCQAVRILTSWWSFDRRGFRWPLSLTLTSDETQKSR